MVRLTSRFGGRGGAIGLVLAVSLLASCDGPPSSSAFGSGGRAGGSGGNGSGGTIGAGSGGTIGAGGTADAGQSGGQQGDGGLAHCLVAGDCPTGSYCFREEWTGNPQAFVCRSVPADCATCACVMHDAQSISKACAADAGLQAELLCLGPNNELLQLDAGTSAPFVVDCESP